MRTAEKTIQNVYKKPNNIKILLRMCNGIVFCDLKPAKHRDKELKQKQIYLHKHKPGLL